MRILTVISLLVVAVSAGCDTGAARRAQIEQAEAQVARIVEDLDGRTTETGVYIRVEEGELGERDPWGTEISVGYSQGGVAETVTVRSAGPDGEFQTDDDIVASGMAANLKGIGEGIKKNVEETSANAAKGAVKGAVEGVKQSIRESLPFGKKKGDDAPPEADVDPAEAQPAAEQPGD